MDNLKEQIAREIAIIRGLSNWDTLSDRMVTKEFGRTRISGYASKEGCYEYAEQILSIIKQAGFVQLQAKEDGLVPEEEIIKYASQDSTYCQLSVDVGIWATKAQKALDDKEKEEAVKKVLDFVDSYQVSVVTREYGYTESVYIGASKWNEFKKQTLEELK
ncbi:MAG: hypothetical protein PHE15_00095 [Dehalococcoidales bacterium]|nr:hypothetical protein [Dehalococcoidales bacterium]